MRKNIPVRAAQQLRLWEPGAGAFIAVGLQQVVELGAGAYAFAFQRLYRGADLRLRYLSAVGNGGTMNIGIAPDRHGRLAEEDVRALRDFDALRRELFAHPVATGPFNVVVLREDVSQGELADSWTLEAGGRTWASGTAVGAKRIRLLADATDAAPLAEEARLSCASRFADAEPKVSAAFYRADPALLAKLAASARTDDDTETARWMTAVKG